MKKLSRITLGLLSAGLLASNVHAAIIKIDGSSTVYPVTEAVAEEFQITTKEKVTVGVSGTGLKSSAVVKLISRMHLDQFSKKKWKFAHKMVLSFMNYP